MSLKVATIVCAVVVVSGVVVWASVARWRENAKGQTSLVDLPQEQRSLRVPSDERLGMVFPNGSRRVLEQSPQLVLFSLEPVEDFDSKPPLFHKHRVLGKMVIASPIQKRALLASLYDGFMSPPIKGLKQIVLGCFMPRHGIRATQNGQVVDLVICFHCRQLDVYSNGKQIEHSFISDSPSPTFNRVLAQNHIAVSD